LNGRSKNFKIFRKESEKINVDETAKIDFIKSKKLYKVNSIFHKK